MTERVSDDPKSFPSLANGRANAGDIWGLLAHPIWGMGALHQKVEALSEHVDRIEMETTKRFDTVEDAVNQNKKKIEAAEIRLIARDFNEAKFGRERLAQVEKAAAEKERHRRRLRTAVWDKGFYVVGVGLGGMALALSSKVDAVFSQIWRHL